MNIDAYTFGRIQIDGVEFTKDVVLLRSEVRSPWWRAAGGHRYAPEDLGEVLTAAPEVVVLGTGFFGRVKVSRETFEAFADTGSEVVVEIGLSPIRTDTGVHVLCAMVDLTARKQAARQIDRLARQLEEAKARLRATS